MKRVSKLTLLAAAVLATACNEKVSPELQNASVTTSTPAPSTSTDTIYSFKLVNKVTDANYKLHKTGAGNKNVDCEVKTTNVPFSRNTFPTDSGGNSFDITCYLEAEELSLMQNGLKLEIQAAPNTCEFIQYSPYGFYNRVPGDSTATYDEIECGNESTNSAQIAIGAAALSPALDVSYSGGGTATCGDYLSNNPSILPNANRLPFTPATDDSELCRFNYIDGDQEKCDIGTVTINKYTFTVDATKASTAAIEAGRVACLGNPANTNCNNYLDSVDNDGDSNPDDGTPGLSEAEVKSLLSMNDPDFVPAYNNAYNSYPPAVSKTTKRVVCGGKVNNCLQGPAKNENLPTPLYSILSQIPANSAGTYTSTYPSILTRAGTYIYANYRRNLANSAINYIQTDDAGYDNAWMDALLSIPYTAYDPALMVKYSFGTSYSTPPSVTTWTNADWKTASIVGNKTIGVPLASEPIQGMKYITSAGKAIDFGVNPFYTYSCLDNARETKARIRLLVRDWNRLLPVTNTSSLEYLTDRPITPIGVIIDDPYDWPRQDIDVAEPDDGSGVVNNFNDYPDWDDLLGMKITAGKYTARLNPPWNIDVFFDPAAFPNESQSGN